MLAFEYTQVNFLLQNANLGCVYKCKMCPYFSKSVFFMENHVRRHHLPLKPFNCSENSLEDYHCVDCDFKTDTFKILRQHIQQNHYVKVQAVETLASFTCRSCGFKTHSRLHLLKHKNECADARLCGKVRKCEFCDYKARYHCDIKRHIYVKHTNPEDIQWLKCDFCNFITKTEYHLKKHKYNMHTTVEWYQCKSCIFKTKSKSHLREHIITHKDPEKIKWYKCDHCDYKACKTSNLNTHILYKHTNHDAIKWFNCEHCDFIAKTVYQIKRHVRFCHTNLEDMKWHKCDYCDFKTKTSFNLRRHTLRWHANLI